MNKSLDILEDDFLDRGYQLTSFLRDFRPQIQELATRPQVLETTAALISLLPIWLETEGRANRKLALELSDLLSKEEQQELYRFAVLVTKLGV